MIYLFNFPYCLKVKEASLRHDAVADNELRHVRPSKFRHWYRNTTSVRKHKEIELLLSISISSICSLFRFEFY